MITLTFLDKEASDRTYELTGEKTTVGRAGSNRIVIPCGSVSARHCEILVWGDDVIVRDLDSANGTFVDEMRLNKQAGARSGQIIRFASVKARLEIKAAHFNDDDSELTAIYDHKRAVRELERRKAQDAEVAVMMVGGGNASPDSVDKTTVLVKPELSQEGPRDHCQ